MAQTYIARTNGGVAMNATGSKLSIYNINASSRVIRVYRIWATNMVLNGTTVTNGTTIPIIIQRLNTGTPTGGTAITPVAFDSTNESLASIADCRTGFTAGASQVASSTYRQILITTDEPTAAALTPDEYWTFPLICEIFNSGYKDSNVEPIVLRPQEGIEVRLNPTAGPANTSFEFAAVFTVSNT